MQAFSTKKLIPYVLSITFTFFSSVTFASIDDFTFNGFFTLDVTNADKNVDIIGTARPNFDASESGIKLSNSLFGAKINYQLSENISFSMLGNLSINEKDELANNITWGYVNYDIGNDTNVRLGKFQTPLLHGTELRTIGISRIWARPIIPGNGASGFNDFKGVDVIRKMSFSDHHWIFQAGIGKPEHGLTDIQAKSMVFSSLTYQYDSFWLRSALMNINFDFYNKAGRIINDDASISMYSVESEFATEYFTYNVGGSFGDSDETPNDNMGYLSVNYPINSFIPFVYFSVREQNVKAVEIYQPPASTITPPIYSIDINTGNQNYQVDISSGNANIDLSKVTPPLSSKEFSWSLGARWNWDESLVFKVQFENLSKEFYSSTDEVLNTNKGNVFSLTVEGWF